MDQYRRSLLIVGCAILLIGVPVADASADEVESSLIRFEIKDQFDQVHTNEMYIGRVLVIVGGDRDGSLHSRHWMKAIRDTLGETYNPARLEVVGVAHLKGVPFFIKGLVKGKMPKEPENWLLLDWKGRFNKAYQFTEKAANILIFDRNGQKVYQTDAQEVEAEALSTILSRLRTQLGG